MNRVPPFALLFALAMLAACAPQREAADQKSRALLERMERDLARTDAEIDSLELRLRGFGDSVRAGVDSQLVALEARRDTAEARLAEAREVGARGWDEARRRFDEARRKLDRAVADLRARLGGS